MLYIQEYDTLHDHTVVTIFIIDIGCGYHHPLLSHLSIIFLSCYPPASGFLLLSTGVLLAMFTAAVAYYFRTYKISYDVVASFSVSSYLSHCCNCGSPIYFSRMLAAGTKCSYQSVCRSLASLSTALGGVVKSYIREWSSVVSRLYMNYRAV